MQPAKKIEPDYTAVVIDFKSRKAVQKQADTLQNENEEKSCFRSNHRYYCKDTECSCWDECHKLIAEWMR